MKTPKVAIRRGKISSPTLWLWQSGHLRGPVLDYGCGYGDDMKAIYCDGYDPNFRPHGIRRRLYETILCHFVICVLEDPKDREEVMSRVWDLLQVGGCAFFTVRRDITREGTENTYWVELDLPILHVRRSQYVIYEMRKGGHWSWQREQVRRGREQ